MAPQIPAAVETTAGRYRDSRRGTVRVDETALGMIELVVELPPGMAAEPTVTRIVIAGEHLAQLAREVNRAARRDRLRSIA